MRRPGGERGFNGAEATKMAERLQRRDALRHCDRGSMMLLEESSSGQWARLETFTRRELWQEFGGKRIEARNFVRVR